MSKIQIYFNFTVFVPMDCDLFHCILLVPYSICLWHIGQGKWFIAVFDSVFCMTRSARPAIWGVTGWCRRGAPYWVVYVYVCMLVHYWILSREEVTYKGVNTLVKQRCTEPKPPPPNLLAMLAKWSWRRIPWRDVLVNMGSVLYSVRSEETQNVLALVFRGLEISNVVWQQD